MRGKFIASLMAGILIVGALPVGASAEWRQDSGEWTYLENGVAKSGWILYSNKWYFLDNEGEMKTGWINDDGTYYYLNSDGTLDNSKTSTVMPNEIKIIYDIVSPYKDGIFNYSDMEYIGNDSIILGNTSLRGKMYYHFYTEDNYENAISEYFYDPISGNIYKHNQGIITLLGTNVTAINNNKLNNSNWKQTSEGLSYYKDGIRQAGWVSDNGKWYYFNTSGIMQIGWFYDNTENKWYYLNNDGSRDDLKTTLTKPYDIIYANARFSRQTNDFNIKYINTINNNGKIIMNFESKETGNKYYYEPATKTAYCLSNGILEKFGEKIGDIIIVDSKYDYEKCKQLALDFFENSHSYKRNEFTMSSDPKADTNGEYYFVFYGVSNGKQIDNCYVSTVTGKVRN